jgi:arylsulfatase A-like enzyme
MKIFLIIFDTLRKDHTGKIYGNKWIKTPNFDKFAKDSLVFDKAYPESLPTIPYRRSIHTGIRTFPFHHKKPKLRTDDFVESPGWYPIPSEQIHLSEYLSKQAYTSVFITSTYHQFKPNMNFHLGFDEFHFIRGQELDKYKARLVGKRSEINQFLQDHLTTKTKKNRMEVSIQKQVLKRYFANVQTREDEEDYFPAKTFQKTLERLEDLQKLNNLFFFIDEFDPHEPWDPPEKYLNQYLNQGYKGNKIIQPSYGISKDYISKEELECMKSCYAGEVSLCDKWFGNFIEKLKEKGMYDEALIILTSDHGHCLGEHGAIGKIPTHLYPELVEVPLVIKPPGGLNGPKRIRKSYIYNHDLLPTIYGFMEKEIPKTFEGKDFSKSIDLDDLFYKDRDHVTCGMALWTFYKDDDFAFITANDKSYQKLFDLSKDPKWNYDISENNQDLCETLFEKINMDANHELLLDFKSTRFDKFEDWYQNTYLL